MNWLSKTRLSIIALFLITLVVSCMQAKQEPETTSDVPPENEFLKKGNTATNEVQRVLGTHLKTQVAKDRNEAINYCNIHGITLTDSLAEALRVEIKRTSLRFRNPDNKPTDFETEILESFEGSTFENPAMPVLKEIDGDLRFFKPIYIQALCLNCHGTEEDMGKNFLNAVIKEQYPDDMATDFQLGELRGMWSVKFLK